MGRRGWLIKAGLCFGLCALTAGCESPSGVILTSKGGGLAQFGKPGQISSPPSTSTSTRPNQTTTTTTRAVATSTTTTMASGGGGSGSGLAAKYPGDQGIASDPAVVFSDDFEWNIAANTPFTAQTITANGYPDYKNPNGMILSSDVPAGSVGGSHSLRLRASQSGANATQIYRPLPGATNTKGFDQLYLRYYIKYTSGLDSAGNPVGKPAPWHHNGIWMGGYFYAASNNISFANPRAGSQVGGGDNRVSISFEPTAFSGGKHHIDFYNYWMSMRHDPNNGYWGNTLIHNPTLLTQDDQWMEVEWMVRLNPNPTSAQGAELALWVNGQLIVDFTDSTPTGCWVWDKFYYPGTTIVPTLSNTKTPCNFGAPAAPTSTPAPLDMRFRDRPETVLNWIWPQNYITPKGANNTVDTTNWGDAADVYIDHIVVATEYIGPLQ